MRPPSSRARGLELDAFRERCEADIKRAREQLETREFVSRNARTGKAQRLRISNSASINARTLAITKTLREILDLRLIADRRELPALLESIASGWPKVEPPRDPDMKESAA